MSPPPDPTDLAFDIDELARQIAPRFNEVESTYESLRRQRHGARPFMTVMAGAATDEEAVAMALRQAEAEGWFAQLADALLRGIAFTSDSAAVTHLQGIVRRAFGFADLADVEVGVARARTRVCKVDVKPSQHNEPTSGSGFLIGPSVIITSFHVVAGLLEKVDGVWQPRAGSEALLTVHFDFATDQAVADTYRVPESEWLVACSSAHDAELGLAGPVGDDDVDLTGHLDYAAVLVAGFPGGERGFYDLARSVDPRPGGALHLMQHPQELKQRYAQGEYTGLRPNTTHRLLHSANSSSGSSGGLLLDADFKLIGLHQGEVPTKPGQPTVNTAISARAIHHHTVEEKADLFTTDYAYQFRLSDDSRPILGRRECQSWVRTAQPIVRVFDRSGRRGLSFSAEIMRACLPPSEHLIAEILVSEIDSEARDAAMLVLDRLHVTGVELPKSDEADTSRGAWITNLVADFTAAIQAQHGDRTCWLVLDDFHRHVLTDTGCRDFLSELYRQTADVGNLRIVLIGMEDPPSGFPTGIAASEELTGPQHDDIERYLRMRMVAGNLDHSGTSIRRLAALTMQAAGAEIERLSNFVANHVDTVINDEIAAQT